MKKLISSAHFLLAFIVTAAHAQDGVLVCEVKNASGTAKTRPVDELAVGSTINIPTNSLVAKGSTFEVDDVFGVANMGESSSMTINRESGEFKFSSWYGNFASFEKGGKTVTGICKQKKLKF